MGAGFLFNKPEISIPDRRTGLGDDFVSIFFFSNEIEITMAPGKTDLVDLCPDPERFRKIKGYNLPDVFI